MKHQRQKNRLINSILILTLTISTLVFTGVGVCVNAASTQTQTAQTQTSAKPPLSPLTKIKTIPEKNAYELQHLEKKGFKYDFFKFLMAMLGVAVSAGAIFLGLKFYKNFVLKSKSNKIEAGDIKNSLESPKDFKEAINLFLDKTDK